MLKTTRSNEVAILGYGCRLPGADGPDAFWKVLTEGRCTVTEIQESRWPKEAFGHSDPAMRGKSYVWAAGQLDDPWAFDPDFFGISPREAEQMDPQQRLVLQVAWEALEHAGLKPSTLPKDRTGVYIGASSSDYSNRFYLDPASIDSQFMTGNTLSLISNRVSYVLDLHGPSQTVDTACSSGLYALHYAVEALKSGQIDTAIVGAVNMLLSPFPFIGFSRASMLSKKGLCRAFDADGDGYVRSEGAAVFVLRAEHVAIAEGDRIRGYVAATGVNTDGRTPGVSQPSADRQAALLRKVYEDGDIDPNDLAFVEAHGTGTAVGDPIEASAVGAVLGAKRDRPLPIGSVKTNVGHLEAGAGLVGLLKAQMALERGLAPASLHFRTPNPNIDFEALNLRVAEAGFDLPKPAALSRPCLAGVNSFGFGGANGHAVLRRATGHARPKPQAAPAPLMLSARSEESLGHLAERFAARLETASDGEAAEIANAAAYRRERLSHRLVVPAAGRSDQISALRAYLADPDARDVAVGRADANAKTAFIFSGNGAQWAGMGREAHATDPVFRSVFDRVSELHAHRYGVNLTDALHDAELAERLPSTSLAQPMLFAIQAGLVESLAEFGLRPDAVLGHSVGEVAAAWAAGVYPLEDAVRLIGARSANQEMLRGLGSMAAVAAPADEIAERLAAENLEEIWIAADNSPSGATISASAASLDAFEEIAEAAKWPMRRLALEYPFHSGFADPMRDALIADLAWLKPEEARIDFVSSAYGRVADGHELGPAYWWKNIRSPVRFREGVESLIDKGCGVFVEIGPKPVLRGYVRDCVAARDETLRYAATLEEEGGSAKLAVARAAALGAAIDDRIFFGEDHAAAVDLPSYPWRNRSFRAENTVEAATLLETSPSSPLLGRPARDGAHDWRRDIDAASPAYFADHVVQDVVVAPAAAMIEMAFAAGAAALADDDPEHPEPIELRNFSILRPIALGGAPLELRVSLAGARGALSIETRRRLSDDAWSPAAAGRIRRAHAAPPVVAPATPADAAVDAATLYPELERLGLRYGPAFRLAEKVEILGPTAAAVVLAAPEENSAQPHLLHPASLDAALHGLLALLAKEGSDRLFLPVSVENAVLHRRSANVAVARVLVSRMSARSVAADIVLMTSAGEVVANFSNFRFKAAPSEARVDPDARRYRTVLVPLPRAGSARPDFSDIVTAGLERGALASEPGDVSPAELIAEAAAQRICLDAVKTGRPDDPVIARLRRLAETEGLIGRDADGELRELAETAPPPLAPLFEALIAETPCSAGLVAYLARLSAEFGEDVCDPASLSPTRAERQAMERDAATATRWKLALDIAAEAVKSAEARKGASILLLGAPPKECVRAFSELPLHRLWIVNPLDQGDPPISGGETAQWRNASDLKGGPDFDLVVACASHVPVDPGVMSAASLAPGGVLLTVSPQDGLLRRLAEDRPAAGGPGDLEPCGRAFFAGSADSALGHVRADDPAGRIPQPRSIRLIGEGRHADIATAFRAAAARSRISISDANDPTDVAEVVVLLGETEGGSEALAASMMTLRSLLAGSEGTKPNRVRIVVEGALADSCGGRPESAAIWGFARVLANENPDVEVRILDLDPSASRDENAEFLAAEIAWPRLEREVVFRGGQAFAPRIQRAKSAPPPGTKLRLSQAKQGDLDSLCWRPSAAATPSANEVVIDVSTTGLNFRDVMWAQGLLPEEALEDGFAGATLGMECAGVVAAVGENVTRFRPGDRVIAYAPACFAEQVVAPEGAVAPTPEGVDPDVAASIPTAFLTAEYALGRLARIEAGETVLVHGAAGGVGLAAIQICAARGAKVFATAGSAAKRALALQLGAAAAFDGRSLEFADQIMSATGGVGVDAVLNSLAGEAMERGVECLKPFGRFVELGKRDFFADSDLGLRPFRRNLSYFGVDADQMMKERPELAASLLADLAKDFADGSLTPPPAAVFDSEDVVEAFRLMQKSGHIGKILVRPPSSNSADRAPFRIRADAAYLVVGGVSGFGAASAEWLAKKGARRIHLASRTAAPDEAGAAAIARIRTTGATVTLHAADVADEAAMTSVFAEIDAAGAPLRGVVHAAMVLDDALFTSLDQRRIERVLRPKVDGANVLDRLTRARAEDLDFLVVYSSATTLVGNPGQAAYVAANAYLEGLMRARRRDGLPGLAVAWGAVSDTGVLARETGSRAALASRLGASRMSAAEALAALEDLAVEEDPAPAFGDIDWPAARRELALVRTPLFEHLNIREADATPPSAELIDRLRGLAPAEALAVLVEMLAGEAARILRMAPEEVESARPLTDLGFDSLMAMDLRMALEERLGVEVPLMSLAGGATLRDVARLAQERLGDDPAEAGDSAVLFVVERHVSDTVEGISRADVEVFAERARSTESLIS